MCHLPNKPSSKRLPSCTYCNCFPTYNKNRLIWLCNVRPVAPTHGGDRHFEKGLRKEGFVKEYRKEGFCYSLLQYLQLHPFYQVVLHFSHKSFMVHYLRDMMADNDRKEYEYENKAIFFFVFC